MIKSIEISSEKKNKTCSYTEVCKNKIVFNDAWLSKDVFTIKIKFNCKIMLFRHHDYNWVNLNQSRLANWHSPKLIKLENNQFVQANQNRGIWEVNKLDPSILLWHFNPENANPIANYNYQNDKKIIQSVNNKPYIAPLSLLFSSHFGIEISRSKIPFSAIVCFTDHCDFDTLSNLVQQRQFFKKHNIKLTKGFFLNNYSKRKDTASYQNHGEELEEWIKDGHELAYHSLSQSVKSQGDSVGDFITFKPPFKDITTWIDHGFQPYNFTLFNCNNELKQNYQKILNSKKIKQLWNYIDSGTTGEGIINQLNPKHFTLSSYYNSIKHFGIKKRVPLMIKNVVFHFNGGDYEIGLYRQVAKYIKTIRRKKGVKKHFNFFINLCKLVVVFLPIVWLWKLKKQKIYPLAKYSPLMFNHTIKEEVFTVFQTLEVIDFKTTFSNNNIDLLVEESGLVIAHTYFSAPMSYHHGKLFCKENEIDLEVAQRFEYLSKKIQSNHIWNPTLQELVSQIIKLEHVVYDSNSKGEINIVNNKELEFRKVT